jgi:integrase
MNPGRVKRRGGKVDSLPLLLVCAPGTRFRPTRLVDHRRKQAEERLKAGAGYQQHDLVFATSEGSPLMPRNLKRRHFRPILKAAKRPDNFRLYDLRHSCATLLHAAGENPKVKMLETMTGDDFERWWKANHLHIKEEEARQRDAAIAGGTVGIGYGAM